VPIPKPVPNTSEAPPKTPQALIDEAKFTVECEDALLEAFSR